MTRVDMMLQECPQKRTIFDSVSRSVGFVDDDASSVSEHVSTAVSCCSSKLSGIQAAYTT